MRDISSARRAICVVLAWLAVQTAGALQPPNFVLIIADDLGYADVGFHGCRDIPTPHLDRLAASGVRCSQGYVSHSFCSPTRAALMTGRYQQRFGHEMNPAYLPDDPTVGLPTNEVTIADVLRPRGYVCGLVGKWHLGAAPPFHPLVRGFDEMFGFLGGGHHYLPEKWVGATEYASRLLRNQEPVKETDYLTRALGREATAFIERHAARPFFLYLAFNAPHTPLEAPPDVEARFASIADPKRRTYAAMVSVMDEQIGRVLDALRRTGTESNTLVMFLSDNGGPPHANASSNGILRGAKGTVYEGGIRVPFVLSFPGRLPAGAVYEEPVICLDLPVTMAVLAGAAMPADRPIDGVNLMPYLLGERKGPPHEALLWRQGGSQPWAIRSGPLKLLLGQGKAAVPELYDLASDPGETRNLAAERPADVAALRGRWERWNAELVPPRWPSPKEALPQRPRRRAPRPAN
ncbi:MAG: sulfatase [Kiritimatiellae bacterium]|nr:sulfatase [Kiritimatiellia bacterium]